MADKRDVLIAIIPSKKDLEIARTKHWYRVRLSMRLPLSIQQNYIKMVAFYQPASFTNEKFIIRWYADVLGIETKKRSDIFPEELPNPKSDDDYFVLKLDELKQLQEPIVTRRPRRIIFINTTKEKFFTAKEINDLYDESPIEEKMWIAMKDSGIEAERQYSLLTKEQEFVLDFAIFCKQFYLAVECDGDTYHLLPADVKNDKKRANKIESLGWHILRYTSDDINYNIDKSIKQVSETINRYGGIEDTIKGQYYIPDPDDEQNRLFD